MASNLYENLGVECSATSEEITRAFRKCVSMHHPDKNNNSRISNARFIEVKQAYDVLRDPHKRAAYDKMLAQDKADEASFKATSVPFAGRSASSTLKRKRTDWPDEEYPGDNIKIKLTVSLKSVFDSNSRILYPRVAKRCSQCSGSSRSCRECAGSGQVFVTRKIRVTIPKGVYDGAVLVIHGAGHDGPFFSKPGNLYILICWSKCGGWAWNAFTGRLEITVRGSNRAHVQGKTVKLRNPAGGWCKVSLPASDGGCWVRVNGLGLPNSASATSRDCAWIHWV